MHFARPPPIGEAPILSTISVWICGLDRSTADVRRHLRGRRIDANAAPACGGRAAIVDRDIPGTIGGRPGSLGVAGYAALARHAKGSPRAGEFKCTSAGSPVMARSSCRQIGR